MDITFPKKGTHRPDDWIQPRPGRNAIMGCKCICVWPDADILARTMWQELNAIFARDRRTLEAIKKVVRVKNGRARMRFDIMVEEIKVKKIFRKLKWGRTSWRIKLDTKFHDRKHEKSIIPQRVADIKNPSLETKVIAWNARSIVNKRGELQTLVERFGPDVLCINETWRSERNFPILVRKYAVFESIKTEGPGKLGVAIVIKKELMPQQVGKVSPYYVAAQATIKGEEWIFMSIYLPTRSTKLKAVATETVERAVREFIDSKMRVMVIGDWNMTIEKMDKLIVKWRLPLKRVLCLPNMSPISRVGSNKWSAIDHCLVSQSCEGIAHLKVHTDFCGSDHWPIEVNIRKTHVELNPQLDKDNNLEGEERFRMNATKFTKRSNEMVYSREMETLKMDMMQEVYPEPAPFIRRFYSGMQKMITGIDAEGKPKGEEGPSLLIDAKTRRLISIRQEAYKRWLREEAPSTAGQCYKNLQESTAKAKKAQGLAYREGTLKIQEKIREGLRETNNSHKLFEYLKSRYTKRDLLPTPLYKEGKEGPVSSTEPERLSILHKRFELLYSDVHGTSQNREYWGKEFFGPCTEPAPAYARKFGIETEEMYQALDHLQNGRAANHRDGLIPEVFKAARQQKEGEKGSDAKTENPLEVLLLGMLNTVFEAESIPEELNTAGICVIYKSGDTKDVHNYRGISLIPVLLKVTMTIIIERIYSNLERKNFFVMEQAGFRKREECTGQLCALVEVLQTRIALGRKTFLAFLDIETAYDTVEHEALFRKLEMAGVEKLELNFIRMIYASAAAEILGSNGHVSKAIKILRGLRQGCPGSPCLFNIFFNDLFDKLRHLGVVIVSVSRTEEEVKIPGLKFADDVALLCETKEQLIEALKLVQEWSIKNHMKWSPSKCGILGVGRGAQEEIQECKNDFILEGKPLPCVSEYKYLGVVIDAEVNVKTMIKARVIKGNKCLATLIPTLRCPTTPMSWKLMLIRACLIPVLTYSGEIWGMNQKQVVRLQTVLDRALKFLIHTKQKSSVTSAAALALEYDIPSVYAISSALRARAILKFRELKTPIGVMVKNPIRIIGNKTANNKRWIRGTKTWLRRSCKEYVTYMEEAKVSPELYIDFKATKWMKLYLTNKSIAWDKDPKNFPAGMLVSVRTLLYYGFLQTSKMYLRQADYFPRSARPIIWLTRFRNLAVHTVNRMAAAGQVDECFRRYCPFCKKHVEESVQHIAVKCKAWRSVRKETGMNELMKRVKLEHPLQEENETKTSVFFRYLLGGSRRGEKKEMNGWLWTLTEEDSQKPKEHPVLRVPGFMVVARCLAKIIAKRAELLREIDWIAEEEECKSESPRANAARDGRANVEVPEMEFLTTRCRHQVEEPPDPP